MCVKNNETDSSKCSDCKGTYIYDLVTSSCIEPTGLTSNCAVVDGTTCISCKDEYIIYEGTCKLVSNCVIKTSDGSDCLICDVGYSYFETNTICLSNTNYNLDENCNKVSFITSSSYQCIECKPGYYL